MNSQFAKDIFKAKYALGGTETWEELCRRVVSSVCATLPLSREDKEGIFNLMLERKFIPGGRYLYAAGRSSHFVNNCYMVRAEDSREGWADVMQKVTAMLMTGGGVGVDYSQLRGEGVPLKKIGGVSSGPLALMHMVNEAGRYIQQGGSRRAALWAGLSWDHPDVFKFLSLKNWPEGLQGNKPLEGTNISVCYDTKFFSNPYSKEAQDVWFANCYQAFKTAEPGFAFNWLKDDESLRNACTEVTSEDDSDKCNLGTLWLNAFSSVDEFRSAVRLATKFLLCGGVYSHTPTDKVAFVGRMNNRIGLGLGGMHDWLLQRGYGYEVVPELAEYLEVYREASDEGAYIDSRLFGVSQPKGVRAIAPTGTISILAESTGGIEPLFCAAYKRRYLKDGSWHTTTVVDGTVKRLLDKGVPASQIQDAYDISFESRVKFQHDVQKYVDMGISSTCNMAAWGSSDNNEDNVQEKADILLKYAKGLRGFTCYPDGARGGQPLSRISLEEGLATEGLTFEDREQECLNGVCGV